MGQKIKHVVILQFYQPLCDTTKEMFVGFCNRTRA
jgi:hypothetical protein